MTPGSRSTLAHYADEPLKYSRAESDSTLKSKEQGTCPFRLNIQLTGKSYKKKSKQYMYNICLLPRERYLMTNQIKSILMSVPLIQLERAVKNWLTGSVCSKTYILHERQDKTVKMSKLDDLILTMYKR